MADPYAADVVLDIRQMSPEASDEVVDHAARHSVTLDYGVVISVDPEELAADLGLLTATLQPNSGDPDYLQATADIVIEGNLSDFDILPYTNDRTIELEFAIPVGFNALSPNSLRYLPLFQTAFRQFEENYDLGDGPEDHYSFYQCTLIADFAVYEFVGQNVYVFQVEGQHYDTGAHEYDVPYFAFQFMFPRPATEGALMQVAVSKARVGMTEDVEYHFRVNDTWYEPTISGDIYTGLDFPPPQRLELGINYEIPS